MPFLRLARTHLRAWGSFPSPSVWVWAQVSHCLCPPAPLATGKPVLPSPSLWLPEFLARPKAFSGPDPLRGRLWLLASADSTRQRGSTSHLVEREKRSNSEGEIK